MQDHRELVGLHLSDVDAKVKYTQKARSLPTYGITFFVVKVAHIDLYSLFHLISTIVVTVGGARVVSNAVADDVMQQSRNAFAHHGCHDHLKASSCRIDLNDKY